MFEISLDLSSLNLQLNGDFSLESGKVLRKIEELLGHQDLQLLGKHVILSLVDKNQSLFLTRTGVAHHLADFLVDMGVSNRLHGSDLLVKLLLVHLNLVLSGRLHRLKVESHLPQLHDGSLPLAPVVEFLVLHALLLVLKGVHGPLSFGKLGQESGTLIGVISSSDLTAELLSFILKFSLLIVGSMIKFFFNLLLDLFKLFFFLKFQSSLLDLQVFLLLLRKIVVEALEHFVHDRRNLILPDGDLVINQVLGISLCVRDSLLTVHLVSQGFDLFFNNIDFLVHLLNLALDSFLLPLPDEILQVGLLTLLLVGKLLIDRFESAAHLLQETLLVTRSLSTFDSCLVVVADPGELCISLSVCFDNPLLKFGFTSAFELFCVGARILDLLLLIVQCVSFLLKIPNLVLSTLDLVVNTLRLLLGPLLTGSHPGLELIVLLLLFSLEVGLHLLHLSVIPLKKHPALIIRKIGVKTVLEKFLLVAHVFLCLDHIVVELGVLVVSLAKIFFIVFLRAVVEHGVFLVGVLFGRFSRLVFLRKVI